MTDGTVRQLDRSPEGIKGTLVDLYNLTLIAAENGLIQDRHSQPIRPVLLHHQSRDACGCRAHSSAFSDEISPTNDGLPLQSSTRLPPACSRPPTSSTYLYCCPPSAAHLTPTQAGVAAQINQIELQALARKGLVPVDLMQNIKNIKEIWKWQSNQVKDCRG